MDVALTIEMDYIVSVRGQVLCRASVNCAGGPGDDLGVAVNGEGCCLGNPDALAYSPPGSDCIACVGEVLHACQTLSVKLMIKFSNYQLLDSSMPHSLEWSRDLVTRCQWAT